ncbi:MAG: Holliday junction resolvase RuvX [Pseudomonadota bacterium]
MDALAQVLAFDFGLKHIGVAVGQTLTRTATPLTTLTARDGKPNWPDVRELVNEWRPERLVVGLPLNMDDTESEMAERARRFAQQLEKQTGLAVTLADERLTTYASRAERRNAGMKSSSGEHAAAAALIAETWLNADS